LSDWNQDQSSPHPLVMGSLFDSFDRGVEKVAAKQWVPFAGW